MERTTKVGVRGLAAAIVAALTVIAPAAVQAQCQHGASIFKTCESPKRSCNANAQCDDGIECTNDVCDLLQSNVTNCTIRLAHADTCGDTTRITEAWDVEDFGGDNVRVPALGNLPISGVFGNAVCCAGPTLPCFVGPPGSLFVVPNSASGCGNLPLPASGTAGMVTFLQNTYAVQPTDPDPLPNQGNLRGNDLCNNGFPGCSMATSTVQLTAGTDLETGCVNQNKPNSAPCTDNDGNACTFAGCEAGSCVQTHNQTICLPDTNPCTQDIACNPQTGACDKPPASASVICRTAAGVCDVAEHCDGSTVTCPPNSVAGAFVTCRPAVGACDVAETCTGVGTACPADTGLPDGDSDAVCDAIDNCDAITNPSQTDDDGDLLGNACDPCTNLVPTVQSKAKLTLTKLLAPANDDKVTFTSFFNSVPGTPTIDPVINGARFLIVDSTGAIPVDITIPPGAYNATNKVGWKVNGSGTAWTYKNAGTFVPLVNGITKVGIKSYPSTPGKFKTQVKGKNGNYPVNTANLPLVPTIVIAPPFAATGQCGEATFPQTPPTKPSCAAVSGGKTVKCK